MATFLLMTEVNIKVKDQQVKRVLFIQYLIKFKKSYTEVKALLHSNGKVNAMILAYAAVLGLHVCSTEIEA